MNETPCLLWGATLLLFVCVSAEDCFVRCAGEDAENLLRPQFRESSQASGGSATVVKLSVALCSPHLSGQQHLAACSCRRIPTEQAGEALLENAFTEGPSALSSADGSVGVLLWTTGKEKQAASIAVRCSRAEPGSALTPHNEAVEAFVVELCSSGLCDVQTSETSGDTELFSKRSLLLVLGSFFLMVLVATAVFEHKIDRHIAGESHHQLL